MCRVFKLFFLRLKDIAVYLMRQELLVLDQDCDPNSGRRFYYIYYKQSHW